MYSTNNPVLSYTDKLLAGAWRFLTYFGRDSMITLLLMQPVLSEGEGGAIEAVIGAVLERIRKLDGNVCHEETIGDYATYLNSLVNVTSTKPLCSYIMIDSQYYLAPVMENYFLKTETGRSRMEAFFAQTATLDFGDKGLSYADLALLNAEKVMRTAEAFAAEGGQTQENLVHLEPRQIVGEWRDSTYGIGGGRIPYDVNTALVSQFGTDRSLLKSFTTSYESIMYIKLIFIGPCRLTINCCSFCSRFLPKPYQLEDCGCRIRKDLGRQHVTILRSHDSRSESQISGQELRKDSRLRLSISRR